MNKEAVYQCNRLRVDTCAPHKPFTVTTARMYPIHSSVLVKAKLATRRQTPSWLVLPMKASANQTHDKVVPPKSRKKKKQKEEKKKAEKKKKKKVIPQKDRKRKKEKKSTPNCNYLSVSVCPSVENTAPRHCRCNYLNRAPTSKMIQQVLLPA